MYSELRTLNDHRDVQIAIIAKAQIAKTDIEFELKHQLIDRGLVECLGVNWALLHKIVNSQPDQ